MMFAAQIAMIQPYIPPVLKVAASIFVVWYASGCTREPRFASGMLSAVMSGFLCFTFLEPMFFPSTELARLTLYMVALIGGAVGLSLGVLLPKYMPGAMFGAVLTLMIGALFVIRSTLYFPITALVLAAAGAFASSKWKQSLFVSFAVSMIAGGVATLALLFPLGPYLMDVARGYTYNPTQPNFLQHASFTLSAELVLALSWLVASVLVASAIVYRDGHFQNVDLVSMFRAGYTSVATNGSEPRPARKSRVTQKSFRDPPPVSPDAYNMFDPADLPPRLAEYANMVYSACEDLGNFFGFQDSSVRNQAEHLLILLSNNRRYMSSHILPPSVQPPSPIHALHAKVFSNYMKWCRAMCITPNFSKMNSSMSAPPAVASRVVDLVLWFCIWGEAANIRHMPECLWFLYHKMMEEYNKSEGFTQTRSLYAGHYLDHVVTPVYEIVFKSMKSKADHMDKRNYDDFNEFFWSRECLKFHYSSEVSDSDIEQMRGLGPLPGEALPPVAEGLNAAPKTFLEKRSWLRGILALNRIIEWHLVTFYLLGVFAFSNRLIWGWVFSLKVYSTIFWCFNFLQLVWGFLEVWASFPGIQLSSVSVCGSVFTLTARYFVLVYQTLYLMWSFNPQPAVHLGIAAEPIFWWWQYIWLSVLCMIPYFAESFLQVFSGMQSRLFASQNDYIQSFLNILYPLSRLYVGKEVHESLSHTAVYSVFWLSMIFWKLIFSYAFEVYPMVLPTLELYDDYYNYPNQSFLQMASLVIVRWFPQLLVYLLDMSIWYSVWQAVAGTSVGLADHLGDVRTMDDLRRHFGQAPESFCKKMLSPDAGSRRGSSASFLHQSSTSLSGEGSSLVGSDPHKLQSYMNSLLDVRIQKWVMFSAAWNEIIDHFRDEDLVSDAESDYLKFSQFDGFNQSIYLPVFQTAGVVDDVLSELEHPKDDVKTDGIATDEEFFGEIRKNITMVTAVSEVWELGGFIFSQMLGPIHSEDITAVSKTVSKWAEEGTLSAHVDVAKLRNIVKHFVAVVKVLSGGLGKRKPADKPRSAAKRAPEPPKQAAGGGFRRVVSATSLASLDSDSKKAKKTLEPQAIARSRKHPEIIVDALRDQVRDKFRAMAHAVKGLVKGSETDGESRDVLDRLTFVLSMENGFLWDDAYASDMLDDMSKNVTLKAVVKKVYGLVACHPDDVEPKSKEVHRRLTFFVNSLFMDMPDAPSIHDMFSWNVLTPYYSEDVIYTKNVLTQRSDALGVSTLLYLQTLYRNDWNNFLERMGLPDDEKIWSKKYISETRRWASIRAQTLSRTVNGMMYYEKALRLLANLERLDDDTTNDLISEKFGYVVSTQVYGNMKRNQDHKAEDIEHLMHRYPHMRIAYIDSIRINRSGASNFYSVLVKSDGKGNVQEIYRIRLPGNPIIGEGKPENQNHAMIFTRGEFVQTIDMNQEGYFEEALKMRNCLQEFAKREGPLPTTLIGLREHIFTGSVSSLANYMALQEMSFVTLGQRVLTRPLHIRLHYGHPDLFDKLFFITRGGVSKASKGINLSEDIFAGFNNVIRGGTVGFKEYLQVGKGRDVGMSQIFKFEAKLSQGNAEQSLSRDVYRLCNRLDFFRLLSFYYGGIGHYFSNVLTVLTVWFVVYLMALLAIYNLEIIGNRVVTPMGTIQMLLGGLGLLQTIPLFATLGVERGWWAAGMEIVQVFVTGGPLHFMFHIQTKANYMTQTILVGGAKYRPTGRGFVTQHTPFDEQFRFFASSHLYLGLEMAVGLTLMGVYTVAGQYVGRTWSLWLASASFLASPFWFNPLSFEWNVVTSDYFTWLKWIGGQTGGATKSWSMWWDEENSFYKGMPWFSKLLYATKAAVWVVMGDGILKSGLFRKSFTISKPPISIAKLLLFVFGLFVLNRVFLANERRIPYPVRRILSVVIFIGLVAGIVIIYVEDIDFIRYSMAGYYFLAAVAMIGLLFGVKIVKYIYFAHDFISAHVFFIPLFILAALQLPSHIQTWLLYHNALSTDVVVSDILRYARKNQESGGDEGGNEELVEQVAELRKLVQKQEEMLASAGLSATPVATSEEPSSTPRAPTRPTDAVADLVSGSSQQLSISAPVVPARSMSMSGLDVWSDMALGDVPSGESGRQEQTAFDAQGQSRSAASGMQGFSFAQPDTMPPR